MVKLITAEELVEIPEGVEVTIEGKTVKVKGVLGELKLDFSHAPVTIKKADKAVKVEIPWPSKKEAALVGTVSSQIKNMITGVTKGFTYKLKIAFAHFPVSVKIDGKNVKIENFTGERSPRTAKIVGASKVTVEGDDVIVRGTDIEAVSQTAANIEQVTKIRDKDPRVFLDGIYVYEKSEGM
jgi:large subunit ribosomal protein L6